MGRLLVSGHAALHLVLLLFAFLKLFSFQLGVQEAESIHSRPVGRAPSGDHVSLRCIARRGRKARRRLEQHAGRIGSMGTWRTAHTQPALAFVMCHH